ncbi:MAG: HAD family phosphatase [Dehalococcoidia bacterium]|nr:HAD family phosphatase [Dehalococcoidia bacterium]
MIGAVLWDMDGVLVDTAPFHYQAWRALFAGLGKDLSDEEFRRTFGLRNDDILRANLGDMPPERLRELGRRKEELFREAIRGKVQPLPGAVALVRRLRESGVKTAVVSSAPRRNVETLLDALGISDGFDALVAEEDAERGKPDPQGYLVAAERLGERPEDCVVIEDAPGGVEAAKRAGMRCIGLAAGREPDALACADVVVAGLEDDAVYSYLGIQR